MEARRWRLFSRRTVTGGGTGVSPGCSHGQDGHATEAYPTILLKTKYVIDGWRVIPMTSAEIQGIENKSVGGHASFCGTLDVVPPLNEGTSYDVDENKGKCFSGAGTSDDVIENT